MSEESALEESMQRYQSWSIATAQVIAELIELAKEMREAQRRAQDLGLSDDEVAFYDALEVTSGTGFQPVLPPPSEYLGNH